MGMSAPISTWVTKATTKRARNYAGAAALLIAVSLQTLPATATLAPVTAVMTEKTEMFYTVTAHADDEVGSWTYLEQLPASTYIVSVLVTKGEGTVSCLPPEKSYNKPGAESLVRETLESSEEPLGTQAGALLNRLTGTSYEPMEVSSGPYRYEGPNSPVGEPDRGERHPLGYPWVGQGTEACADARVASWHWFLDGSHRIDGIGTDLEIKEDPEQDDDYMGSFCPPGPDGWGRRSPSLKPSGCAQVWADREGARVVFDLGNASLVDESVWPDPLFTAKQVTAALQATRSNRSAWSIPVLPESGVFSHSYYNDGSKCPVGVYAHPDHRVVQDAIRYIDQGLPVQAGPMACPFDPYGEEAEVRVVQTDVASLARKQMLDFVDGRRIGPASVNYGWLFPEYPLLSCPDPFLACLFWEVRNP